MNVKDFEAVLQDTISRIESILSSKSAEYSTNTDRLANFKSAAAYLGCEPETALLGMWTKHLISLKDFIQRLEHGDILIRDTQWNEKILDTINYAILLRGLLKERGLI